MTALTGVGAVVVYLLVAWLIYRRGYELVMQRAAAEWEKLAQAQEKRIDALERDGERIREENDELKRINANLISLNLELQTELQRKKSSVRNQRTSSVRVSGAPLTPAGTPQA